MVAATASISEGHVIAEAVEHELERSISVLSGASIHLHPAAPA